LLNAMFGKIHLSVLTGVGGVNVDLYRILENGTLNSPAIKLGYVITY
jgi:hypothetical protein